MDLKNISVGQRIPNYRDLCKLLDEPVEAGNSKKAQLHRWERYFAFRREKNAYIITEVYDVPKALDDGRMRYAQHLTPVLLNYLAQNGVSEQSFERWFVALGMADEALFDEKRREDVRLSMGLSPFQMQKLVCTVDSLCRRTLMNTLNALRKGQTVAHTAKEYIVTGMARRLATAEEQVQIQHRKNEAMAAVGATSMFAVQINPVRRIRFYEVLADLYKNCGWDRTYTLLEIMPLDIEEIGRYADVNVQAEKGALNSGIKAAVIAQLRSEYQNADRKCMEEWVNDAVTEGFKLDRMTAELLIHVLQSEI